MAEIRIENLVKRFGEATALSGVSLSVADGEVLALLGPSGCGKTTMLRCIAGLEQPTSGLIEVGGTTLVSGSTFVPPSRRNIGMVFQSYALWPHMTVAGNVAYGLRIQKMPKAQLAARVDEVLKLLGLQRFADRYPGQLSGGQQQRVAVARALALRADVVLFDEPLSNLDLRLREEVRGELRRVFSELGVTVVYVTHDIGEAVVVADRIAMLDNGEIVQIGTPEDVYHSPASSFVAEFAGNVNMLTAEVQRVDGSTKLCVGDAFSFCPSKTVGSIPPDADSVRLMVRPEYVEIDDLDDFGTTDATIADVEFLGQVTVLKLAVEALKLRAITLSRPSTKLVPGSNCRVRILDENVVVVPDL